MSEEIHIMIESELVEHPQPAEAANA